MMYVVARTALGLCLGMLLPGGTSAQEQSLDGLLVSLNDQLRQNSYRDHDGQETFSRVLLPGDGTVVVETTKRGADAEVTNIFVASLGDLDLTRVSARSRDEYTSLSLGARGEVRATLRCTTRGGPAHEWALPNAREIAVEFRQNARLASELTEGFRELIRRARNAPTGP